MEKVARLSSSPQKEMYWDKFLTKEINKEIMTKSRWKNKFLRCIYD